VKTVEDDFVYSQSALHLVNVLSSSGGQRSDSKVGSGTHRRCHTREDR